MTVRLYRAKGEFEAYSLAPDAAAAVRLATRGRQCCERVYEATAEVVTAAVGPLATRCPDRVDVAYESELGGRGKWTVAQWAAAAPADAAAEADRLRTEAVACDLRAAKLRAEAEELAKIAARAQGTETAQEPEPSEANRVAAFVLRRKGDL